MADKSTKKEKRARNKAKNEALRAKNLHPKQLRALRDKERHYRNIDMAARHDAYIKDESGDRKRIDRKKIHKISKEALAELRKSEALWEKQLEEYREKRARRMVDAV